MCNKEYCSFEQKLAFHTAPSLLGIKCASLMSLYKGEFDIAANAERFNSRAAARGLKIKTMCECGQRVLLLLYVITGGVDDEDAYDELDEDYITPEERLETHCWRIDMMLDACGMGRLDPRNAFDWLILYSLRVDEDSAMDERMEAVLGRLFDAEDE